MFLHEGPWLSAISRQTVAQILTGDAATDIVALLGL